MNGSHKIEVTVFQRGRFVAAESTTAVTQDSVGTEETPVHWSV